MGDAVRVLAWNDANGNEILDAGDLVGEHPTSVVVAGGARVDGVDITLEPVVDVPEGLAQVARVVAGQPAGGFDEP
jgi:hypothetical protein